MIAPIETTTDINALFKELRDAGAEVKDASNRHRLMREMLDETIQQMRAAHDRYSRASEAIHNSVDKGSGML